DLAPALGLVLGAHLYIRDDGDWTAQGPSGPLTIESKDDGDIALFLGIRLSLPFAHLGGRLFRFSRAEAPTGFAFHVLVGGGFALLGGMNLYYSDPSDMSYQDRPYWKSSTGVCFAFGARLEYRWVNFAVFLDFTAVNLGEPEPTDDPEWAASAEAGPVVPLVGSLGISVHF
ncbi:MAG: hypothetical protein MUC63_03835, partial [Planctomycetes bacterium]|nr:hypothetical protein [Planctomycetota bacterium]